MAFEVVMNAVNHTAVRQVKDAVLQSSFPGSAEVGAYWDHLLTTWQPPVLMGVTAVVLHLVFYLIAAVFAFIFPIIPFLHKFKIQQNKVMTKADVWECVKNVAMNQFVVELPLYYVLGLFVSWMGYPYAWSEVPHWTTYVWKTYLALVIEDAWHYWLHRLLHHRAIYGAVHKLHHMYNSPFTMTAEYAHPIETIVLGTGFFLPILALCDHVVFMYVWLAVRMLETADVHSGYDIPLNPLRLLPFYGGPRMHDAHHKLIVGNYSSSFTWWDRIFGTYIEDPKACVPVDPKTPLRSSRLTNDKKAEGRDE